MIQLTTNVVSALEIRNASSRTGALEPQQIFISIVPKQSSNLWRVDPPKMRWINSGFKAKVVIASKVEVDSEYGCLTEAPNVLNIKIQKNFD